MAQGIAGYIGALVSLAVVAAVIAGLWKAFEKAGVEGWKSLIPIYNLYLAVKIGDMPGWLLLLLLVPVVNWFAQIYIYYRFAENYGKGTAFSLLTGLLPFIGIPVIGFDDSTYQGSYGN